MAYSQLAQSAEEELVRQREYAQLVERVRGLAESAVPAGSVIAVVSKGDSDLLRIEGRVTHHFPRMSTGGWAGHHPADDADAIGRLEAARAEGAKFLLLPATSLWWLDHYAGFAQHLEKLYRRVADQPDTAIIFSLEGGEPGIALPADHRHDAVERNARSVVEALLPPGARVVSAGGWAAAGIAELDEASNGGAEYVVIPDPAEWFASHPEAREYLETRCVLVTNQENACAIYELRGAPPVARMRKRTRRRKAGG